MKKYFFRIIDAGHTINGVHKFKIVGYKKVDWSENQYDYLNVEQFREIGFGRISRASHSVSTQWYKQEIIDKLDEVYKDEYSYIFE